MSDTLPALLLHGQPGSAGDWKWVIDELAGRVRTIAMQRPGYDGTRAGGVRHSAEAALEHLDAAGADQAIVVGHSYGGAIAAWLAAFHPERVAGLVLVSAAANRASLVPADRWLAAPLIGPLASAGLLWSSGLIAQVPVLRRKVAGQMRGTSRREDAAAWVIRLDDATDATSARTGAKFISTFAKPSRNTPENPPPLEWSISTNAATGRATVGFKKAEGEEAVLGWVRHGLTLCGEFAEEMGISKGSVSKMASKLIEAGKLCKDGRGYSCLPETAARRARIEAGNRWKRRHFFYPLRFHVS